MLITVTTADIANGAKGFASTCPVALALSRETRRYCLVAQDEITVYDESHKASSRMTTPELVVAFINNFDGGRVVEPFTFELDIPC